MNRLLILLMVCLINATLFGCKSSTEVTTAQTVKVPWIGSTQNPQFPLILSDTSGATLTAVYDTSTHRVIGAIHTRHDSTEVIFLSDSVVPTKVIIGPIEVIYSNYTDSSVDVLIVDTSGDIGIMKKVDIKSQLSHLLTRSNIANKSFPKSKLPNFTFHDFENAAKAVASAWDFHECILPILANMAVYTGQGEIALPLLPFFRPPDFDACGRIFDQTVEYLHDHGGFSNEPPAPREPPKLQSPNPWERSNEIDKYVGKLPGRITWSVSGPQEPCGDHPVLGSYSTGLTPSYLSGNSRNVSFYLDRGLVYMYSAGPCGAGWEVSGDAVQEVLPIGVYGAFSISKKWIDGHTYTISGSYHY